MKLKSLIPSRAGRTLTAVLVAINAGMACANEPLPHPATQLMPQHDMIGQYHPVDPIEAETLRAGFGPLALALGITSVDLALMGMYWGVYVPSYANQEPAGNYAFD